MLYFVNCLQRSVSIHKIVFYINHQICILKEKHQNDIITYLLNFLWSWVVAIILTEILSSSRHIYLGLTVILGTVSIFLSIAVLFILKKNYVSKHRNFITKRERTMVSTRFQKENCTTSDHLLQPKYWPGKETQL